MPASSCSRSSAYMRDRPSEAASSPAACGASSGRAVSAPRTIVASRPSAGNAAEAELLDHRVEGAQFAAMAPEHALDVERRGVHAARRRRRPRPERRTERPRRDRRSGGSATGRRSGRPWAGRGSPSASGPPRRAAAARLRGSAAGRRRSRRRRRPRASRPGCRRGGARRRRRGSPRHRRRRSRTADGAAISPAHASTPLGARGGATPGMRSPRGAEVDERRARRRADQADQLVGRDGVDCGHAASFLDDRTRCFSMSPHGVIAIPMAGLEPAGLGCQAAELDSVGNAAEHKANNESEFACTLPCPGTRASPPCGKRCARSNGPACRRGRAAAVPGVRHPGGGRAAGRRRAGLRAARGGAGHARAQRRGRRDPVPRRLSPPASRSRGGKAARCSGRCRAATCSRPASRRRG